MSGYDTARAAARTPPAKPANPRQAPPLTGNN